MDQPNFLSIHSGLHIIQWNASSLYAHGDEFKVFLEYFDRRPDVLWVCTGDGCDTLMVVLDIWYVLIINHLL